MVLPLPYLPWGRVGSAAEIAIVVIVAHYATSPGPSSHVGLALPELSKCGHLRDVDLCALGDSGQCVAQLSESDYVASATHAGRVVLVSPTAF